MTVMTSCLEVSECWLSVSVTVVGGVELDDARFEESSVAISTELLLSMAASRDDSMASTCEMRGVRELRFGAAGLIAAAGVQT